MPSHKDVRGVHKNVSDLQSEEFSKECKALVGKVFDWKKLNRITWWYLQSDYILLQQCCVLQ